MISPDKKNYIYADIAVNTNNLNSQMLAEIAVETSKTAKLFGIDPKIAMISFSTKGSAISPDSRRMAEAAVIARNLSPDLVVDGEMQFDTAAVPSIGKEKAPDSPVAGEANVFIYPDIQSGNIAYKITQHLGGYKALGPLIQGLNKPVNDLSRGCSEDDVHKTAIITAAQSIG